MRANLLRGFKITTVGPAWDPVDVNDPVCERGCENIADEIASFLGGRPCEIRPRPPGFFLGPFRGKNWLWVYHVVVKGELVHDITTGSHGVEKEAYKRFWEYADAIDFGF